MDEWLVWFTPGAAAMYFVTGLYLAIAFFSAVPARAGSFRKILTDGVLLAGFLLCCWPVAIWWIFHDWS